MTAFDIFPDIPNHFLVEVTLGDSSTIHTMLFPYLAKIGYSLLNETRFYVSHGRYTIQA